MKRSLPLILICILYSGVSCTKDIQVSEEEEVNMNEVEDCTYVFKDNLDDIYGVWSPKILIDKETGDSTFYEVGEGHMGFMLVGHYSDSFELRDNGSFSIFYISSGRHCEDSVYGDWSIENRVIDFYLWNQDTVQVPVIKIEKEELIIEDVIDFRESRLLMRRVE